MWRESRWAMVHHGPSLPTAPGSYRTPGRFRCRPSSQARRPRCRATLLAVIPPEVAALTFKELSVAVGGPLILSKGNLRIDDDGTPGGKAVRFDGALKVRDIAFDAGVPITEAAGTIEFQRGQPGPLETDLRGLVPSRFVPHRQGRHDQRARPGRRRRQGRAGPRAAGLRGLLRGKGFRIMRMTTNPAGVKEYETTMALSGVRFAPVLNDLGALKEDGPVAPAMNPAQDTSRGTMDASMSLGGRIGDDTTPSRAGGDPGRGAVLRLPLVLPLVQVSNLQLPTEERLSRAVEQFLHRRTQRRVRRPVGLQRKRPDLRVRTGLLARDRPGPQV